MYCMSIICLASFVHGEFFCIFACTNFFTEEAGRLWGGGRREGVSHCIKSELYFAKWNWILRSGPKLKMLVKFHRSNGSFPNPLNWWWIRFGCTALDQCYWNKENWFANWKSTMHFPDLHILASTMPLIIEFFFKIKSQFGRFWEWVKFSGKIK